MIFSKTLVDRLNLHKVKGKTKMKWSGPLIELQDFVTLILNEKGKLQSKTNAGVDSYTFTQKDSKFRINWWTSTGTFNVQGETKICNKIIKKITQLLEGKTGQEDNIESLRSPSFEVEETQEENKIDEKVKERKPRQGRPPGKPAPETPLNEPVKEKPLDELRRMFDSEVKKLWEAFHSITKQISQQPKFNNEKDFQDIPNVSTSNRFEQLSKSKETRLSDQKKTKTVSVNSKDKGQLKIQASEKKLHELEHQLQVKETVIKNLASTNEHLTLEITNLRKRSNLEQPETKKIMTTSASATKNAESSNSAKSSCMKEDLKEKKDSVINNKSKRKPQVFIVRDSMTRNLKVWLMARDNAVKVYTFPGASCEDMENYPVPLTNRKPDKILLHVGTNDL